MRRLASAVLSLTALLGTAACAGARYHTVTYPPRVDLSKHEIIGVVEFYSPDDRELASLVTSRFTESARQDQGVIRMVSLRSEGGRPTPERLRQLAEQHGLRTIVVGELRLSDVRSSISVSETFKSGSLSASVEATLAVEMIEPSTGASLWSASGRAQESLGGISVQGAKHVDFGGGSPDAAYANMVDTLVNQVTRDMHSTWERQRVP